MTHPVQQSVGQVDARILPERELEVGYVEDGVVSVDHEDFILAVDEHHVPAERTG